MTNLGNKLKESEIMNKNLIKELEILLDLIPGLVYVKDKNDKIIRVNQTFANYLKVNKEDIIGRTTFDFFPEEQANKYRDDDLEVIKSRKPKLNIEEFGDFPDGKMYAITSKVPIFNDKGEIDGIIGLTTDITEKKIIEQKLKESEEMFRMIAEQILMGIAIIQDDVVKYINKQFADLLGYSVEEITKWNPAEFIKTVHPKDREMVLEHAKKRQAGLNDDVNHYIYRSITKTEKVLWFEVYAKTIIYKGGPADLVTIINISEKKDAEEKLIESEKKYRNMIENLDVGFYKGEFQGKLLMHNKTLNKIFGLEPSKSLVGTKSFQYIVDSEELKKYHRQLIENGFVKDFLMQVNIPNRGKIITQLNAHLIRNNKGEPLEVEGTFLDVTEQIRAEQKLIESEEKFRMIADQNFMAIAILQDDTIKYVNRILIEMFGYTEIELLNLQRGEFIKLIHPEDRAIIKMITSKRQRGEPIDVYEHRYRAIRKNGQVFWIDAYSKTIIFKEKPAVFAAFVDITDRLMNEQKLKKSEEKYREAYNRANFYKDLFAHDVNNIYQSILSSSEICERLLDDKKLDSEEFQKLINIIKRQVMKGSNIIENIQMLSKIEEKSPPLLSVNLIEILKDSVNFARESYNKKNMNIEEKLFQEIIKVKANNFLRVVFENILTNAIKYNERDPIKITIKVSKEVKNKIDFIKIEIIDNGMGIPDNRKNLIFERASYKQRKSSGMGLGLALVSKIIESYNGEIWIEDRIKGDCSQGSIFVILIPEAS